MDLLSVVIGFVVGVIVANIVFIFALGLCRSAATQDPESEHYQRTYEITGEEDGGYATSVTWMEDDNETLHS